MHRRQTIRDALVLALAGVTAVSGRIYPMRARILGENELPALRIYTARDARDHGEPGETLTGSPTLDRVECRIEILAKAADDVEDAIDAIAEAVETALDNNPTLTDTIQWIVYQSTEIDFEDEDETVMQATLVYEAEFLTE